MEKMIAMNRDINSTNDDVVPIADTGGPCELGKLENAMFEGGYSDYVDMCYSFKDCFSAPLPVFTLDDWQKYIHAYALEKGWWKRDREPLEVLALIHSEVSEACEDFRDGEDAFRYDDDGKPIGWAVELVDAMIRTLDFLGANQIRTGVVMAEKANYNDGREYRHGGKEY